MSTIISVSLKEEQLKFIKDNHLSPSRLLQDAITYLDTENVTSMLKHNAEIRAVRAKLLAFLEQKNLLEEYSNYVLEKKTD